jgi:F0F1-type ATP synthase assembly protein I
MRDTAKVLKELSEYLWKTKKWWLIPVVLLIFIIGILIFIASTSPVPVFIYPLV